MKVSGFTLVRNGVKFDYPFMESIQSLLPMVNELVVNVGIGEDETLAQIQALAQYESKLVLFQSDWQLHIPEKKKGGQILSEQTNLALQKCQYDWCIYLQADEVLHEKDYPLFKNSLEYVETQSDLDGLLLDYVHFYGSYDVYQHTRSTYRSEVRAIRRSSTAHSMGDAQSFRKQGGEKLRVFQSGVRVFHYGWVRAPEAMKEKTFFMDQLYHGAPTLEEEVTHTPYTGDNYRYKRILGLYPFHGVHPQVMWERIQKKGWHWDLSASSLTYSWRDIKKIVLDWIERKTGYRLFEYKSYKKVHRAHPSHRA